MNRLLRSPDFRRLWLSSVAQTAAQGIERTVTAWLALQLGADAFAIGLIFAARMLPSLLFGLAAGTIADQADRPRQLLAVAAGAAALMAAFGWLVAAGGLRVGHVVLFGFVAGCVQVFDTPARQALVLDIVPADAAQRALALSALATRLATALGALAAGALLTQAGMVPSYIVAAGVFGLAALLVGTMRVPQAHRTHAAPPPFRQAFRDSIRMIAEVPGVRDLIVVGLICEIFAFSHLSALPRFAQDVLAAGPAGLGTINAAVALGGAAAVALLSLVPERVPRQPLLGATYLVFGLAIVGVAATRTVATAAIVLVVVGCCAAAFDVLQQTLIQLAVPPAQRGRAVGLWVFSIGSAPIGHLEMGALANILGVPAALLINGALTVAAAALLLLRSPEYRWAAMARLRGSGQPSGAATKPQRHEDA
jgi:MFS family permease